MAELTFASIFASAMAAKGYTDAETARALGVSQPTVTRWRLGRQTPHGEQVAMLAEFCGAPERAIHKALLPVSPRRGEGAGTFADLICKLESDRNLEPSDAWRKYGVDKSTYYRWRTGKAAPRLHEIPTVASKLGVSEERVVLAVYRTEVTKARV